MSMETFDKVIIGAGFYGLYSALKVGRSGQKVLVLEKENEAFTRASYINQARVHMGYHYPRSLSTAMKSARYFSRFCEEFAFRINEDFEQIYATSNKLSWTNGEDFNMFCENAEIPCTKIDPDKYFQHGLCDGAFITKEYCYDAQILKKYLLETIALLPNVRIEYSCSPICIKQKGELWEIKTEKYMLQTAFLLNASYAGVNEILKITEGGVFSSFKIKYEKCEIILCEVNEKLKKTGITVMDGPFFSIMPFGKTGLHSLTSVAFTPHETSYEQVAEFPCQKEKKVDNPHCIPGSLENCNICQLKPDSAWAYMSSLTRKYLKEELNFTYHSSLYSIKPILVNSEVDDSRPTLIRKHCSKPTLISVLSGKINTVYDLDEVLVDD